MKARILVVDDEEAIRRLMLRMLQRKHYAVLTASSGTEALELMAKEEIDVALVDLNLRAPDGMDGHDIIRRAAVVSPRTRCVMVTGEGQPQDAYRALTEGACDFLSKLDIPEALDPAVERALLWRKAAQDPDFPELIGRSPAIVDIQRRIRKVAGPPVTVLIQGESGTGKERVAKAIHAASRCDGPFIAINCAALAPGTIESDLFGHEKGAFTGAVSMRKGAFERAEGGVLLLDEIGDMPADMQAKLLRVLQERVLTRLGGSQEIPVTCRVLAATHVSLEDRVRQGRFREDLYYRLRQCAIRVPPLRERLEDVPMLIWYFVQVNNRSYGYSIQRITPNAMELLRTRSWQANNVRQLENAVLNAMIEADDDVLEERHFDRSFIGGPLVAPAPSPMRASTDATAFPDDLLAQPFTPAKHEAEDAFRRWYLARKLELHGSVAAAARESGLQPSNFRREMRRVGLEGPESSRR